MANKRMFSKQITESDAFLDMPVSSQLLYFHLNMSADDDGFVANPKRVMRMVGVQEDDFKILLAKRFLLAFKNGVVVIKHWLLHNAVRKDMYKETQYIEEKKQLKIKENRVYTEVRDESVTKSLHSIDKVRLGQVRLDKNRSATKVAVADKKRDSDTMSLQEFITWVKNPPGKIAQRHLCIIADYADEKKVDFTTYGQWQAFIKRNLRAAQALSPFTDKQIGEAMERLNEAQEDYLKRWTLESLNKYMIK